MKSSLTYFLVCLRRPIFYTINWHASNVKDKGANMLWGWLRCLCTVNNKFFRYVSDAKSDAPRWAYMLCGAGLFVYQSLDAIDGKQARRTGTAGPLGELFDHGCDSISTVFVAVSACMCIQLGNYPACMFFQVRWRSEFVQIWLHCSYWHKVSSQFYRVIQFYWYEWFWSFLLIMYVKL